MSNNGSKSNAEQLFEEANEWESSKTEAIEKSERRAWLIVKSTLVLVTISWLTIGYLVQKQPEPFVIRVNETSGAVDIMTALNYKDVTGEDAMDKFWLNQYVLARETYDWYTLQNDYNKVGLLSSPNVGRAYAELFDGKNALDKKYGTNVKATVVVHSVVPSGDNVGTVRFTKTIKRVDEEGPGISTSWIATVAYEYNNPALMPESKRLINPYGFQVLSYRVDPEMVGGGQ